MSLRLALIAPLILGYCSDETLTGYGAQGQVFVLESINGAPFPARASIGFPKEGQITGQAPCNSFSATQEVPYPWFKAGPIVSTKRACPDLTQEQLFFDALSRMTLSEVSGPNLILSTAEGDRMEFTAE
ncbi:MAG: META domain-containing protein [Litoreibacter sp.]|nr:META domain-containing protein [Litoreibacter sp.]